MRGDATRCLTLPVSIRQEEARTVLREKAEAEDGEISHLIFGEVPLLSLAKILDACDEFAGPQGCVPHRHIEPEGRVAASRPARGKQPHHFTRRPFGVPAPHSGSGAASSSTSAAGRAASSPGRASCAPSPRSAASRSSPRSTPRRRPSSGSSRRAAPLPAARPPPRARAAPACRSGSRSAAGTSSRCASEISELPHKEGD